MGKTYQKHLIKQCPIYAESHPGSKDYEIVHAPFEFDFKITLCSRAENGSTKYRWVGDDRHAYGPEFDRLGDAMAWLDDGEQFRVQSHTQQEEVVLVNNLDD